MIHRRRPRCPPGLRALLALVLAACAVVLAAEAGQSDAAAVEGEGDANTNHNTNAREPPSGAPTPSDRQSLQGTPADGAGTGRSRGNRKPANRRRGPAPAGAPKHTVNHAARDPTARPSVDVPRGGSGEEGERGYRPTVRSSDGSSSNMSSDYEEELKKRYGLTTNNNGGSQSEHGLSKESERAFEYHYEYGTDPFSKEIGTRFKDDRYTAAEVHAFIKRRKAAKEEEHARIVREAEVLMAGKTNKEVAKFVERRKKEEREKDQRLTAETKEFVRSGSGVTPAQAAEFVSRKLEERRRIWDMTLDALEEVEEELKDVLDEIERAQGVPVSEERAAEAVGAAIEAAKHDLSTEERSDTEIVMDAGQLPPVKPDGQKKEATQEKPYTMDKETVERLAAADMAISKYASPQLKKEVFDATKGQPSEWTTNWIIQQGELLLAGLPETAKEKDGIPTTPPPTAQPTANDPTYQYAYEAAYDEIFRPQMEEYDAFRFDPYSLSGAPIGGWGRATRSRLATLPIRLVSDFDGGVDLLFGSGEEEGDEKGEKAKDSEDGDGDAEQTPDGKAEASAKSTKTASASNGVQPSTGPHFSIHDSFGQRYVCRAYDEDELVVLSRIDSVFHPAMTIWDDAELASPESHIPESVENKGNELTALVDDVMNAKDGAHVKKHFHFSINGGGEWGNVPEGMRSSLAKMLRKMGMHDAAGALAGEQELQDVAQALETNPDVLLGADGVELDVDVDVLVIDAEGAGDDVAAAVAEQGADELANIIKAAAVGAGLESVEDAKKDGDGEKRVAEKKNAAPKKPKTPPQLTSEEIYQILTRLDGLCSQLHLGWWSYEWCHQSQVRQFHVAVSTHPATFGKYDIEDVTLLGLFHKEVQIIYPKGMYNGQMKKGRTESVVFNSKGIAAQTHITPHTPHDDARYSGIPSYHTRDHILDNHQRHKQKMAKLGHGGPIVRHTFTNGDLCEEAGRYRQMEVELRCCTEEEIDHWLESKKQRPGHNKREHQHGAMPDKPKAETPLAVLVGVQEDETCVYRSRVCTPLLCPKPVDDTASEGEASIAEKPISKQMAEKIKEQSKNDPFGALLTAIFGDDLVDDAGQVDVFFPEGDIGEALDELVQHAEGGGDFINNPTFEKVKEALRSERGLMKKYNLKELLGEDDADDNALNVSPHTSPVKETDSIRDILDMTLGRRPCLLKNLGWWTYEFCHSRQIRQFHANNLIDAHTGFAKQVIETEHLLGKYANSGNSISDYPDEDEHLHVINATGSTSELQGMGNPQGKRKQKKQIDGAPGKNGKQPGGNGAVYVQEYSHGDVCDHEDVAESVIKGGNVVTGSVERSSTVRFSCGKRWEMIDIKEDSTCHYVVDVTVPELCQHKLFKAPVTKTQVVKCLPAGEGLT